MSYIQIIEFHTTKPDEVASLIEDWAVQTKGRRSALRGTLTADRDRPDTYLQIVEFPDAGSAARNSALPETAALAKSLAAVCEGGPRYSNLDVRQVYDFAADAGPAGDGRKVADCRDFPSESGCTLTISGRTEEVLAAAAAHAVAAHGHTDDDALADWLRNNLKDEVGSR